MNGVERSHAMAPISSTIRLVSSKTTIEEEDGIQKESVMLSLRQLEDVFTRLNSLKLGFAAEDQADAWPDPVVVQGRADSMPRWIGSNHNWISSSLIEPRSSICPFKAKPYLRL